MARADASQQTVMEHHRTQVLATMRALELIDAQAESMLFNVRLGVLRSSATQRHGATRWVRETNGALTVDVVDLHPNLLTDEWSDYAQFVLFHEFLHVLGHRAHDSAFRTLERSWPDRGASQQGKAFTHARRMARATWHWVCTSCDQRFPRQRRGGGRYLCRTCRTVLVDERVQDIQ